MLLLALFACAGPSVADPADPGCLPAVEIAGGPYVEGDTITATVSCQTGVANERVGLVAVELPDGAAHQGGEVTWVTDLDDAGVHEVVFATDAGETATARIPVADAWNAPGNTPVVAEDYPEELGLPVLHVFTAGPLSEEYVGAEVVWEGERITEALVKKRGAASLGYPKTGLMLEFEGDEIDLDSIGIDKRDHIALLTTFDDNSYVRQKLAFDVWADIAETFGVERPTPRTAFVVVYLDGAYWGLFVVCDRIDDEFFDQMGLVRDGNVYKSVSHDANFYGYGDPRAGFEKEEGDPDDWSDLEALVAFTGGSTAEQFWAGAPDRLRVDEFMDWFLFVHFLAADDSAGKNAYLQNDPYIGEFRFVPWDFNHSWGQTWQTLRVAPTVSNDFRSTNRIFDHFQAHPEASAELWDRWETLRTGPFSEPALVGRLDAYFAAITPSAQRDEAKWGEAYRTYGGWAGGREGDWTDFAGEQAYLYAWVKDRAKWAETAH
jgi:spore coat protein H